jgi:hypothetical protein
MPRFLIRVRREIHIEEDLSYWYCLLVAKSFVAVLRTACDSFLMARSSDMLSKVSMNIARECTSCSV